MLRVIAAAVLAVTATLGGAGLSVSASQRALPRQSLYPVKLLTENVRTAVAFDDVQAAELQVDFAIERADEVLALAQQGDFEALGEALERLERQLDRATEAIEELWEAHPEDAEALATRLEGKLAEVAAALEQLPLEGAPEEARELVGEAIDVMRDGQEEVLELLGVDMPEVEDDEETPEIEESEDDSEIEEDEIEDIEDDDSEIEEDEIDDLEDDEPDEDEHSIEDDDAEHEEIHDSAEVDEHEEDDDSHKETGYSSDHEDHEEHVETGYTSGDHEHEEYDD